MHLDKICDTCRYYYAHGLTYGVCMLFCLSTSTSKDKEVSYTDTCNDWTLNDDVKKHQTIRYTYEKLKKEHAIKNMKKNN